MPAGWKGWLCAALLLLVPLSTNAATPSVVAGGGHSVALKNDGTVVAVGNEYYGQLGLGRLAQSSTPLQVLGLGEVRDLAAGDIHTLALKLDGTVWAWGNNQFGQLGDGTAANRSAPVQVVGLAGVAAIAAGGVRSLALKQDGTVWEWGYVLGQLGDGGPVYYSTPVQVAGLAAVAVIAASGGHTVALMQDGTVWAWGNNTYGQLGGVTSTPYRGAPAQVAGLAEVITAIAVGSLHTIALKQDGTVWAWGNNTAGRLGDGTTDHRNTPVQVAGIGGVTAIAAGGEHTLALEQDGTVWAWGRNDGGQLGDGTTTDRSTPVQVPGLAGVTAIAAGRSELGSHTVSLKQDGTVWAWGNNQFGQLGDGTTANRSVPEQVAGLAAVVATAAGGGHTVAVKHDGTVWAWGDNATSQLGDGTTTDRSTPVQVAGLAGVTAIATVGSHTLALKQDGTVWGWGQNHYGQLGDGAGIPFRGTPAQVGGLAEVTAIAAGGSHTVALRQDGTVWAWGWNGDGQLGDGTTINRSTPAQVAGLAGVIAIAAGGAHTLALKQDGMVWAWGSNYSGQLGDGTTTDRSTPVQVAGLDEVTAIAAGAVHTVALKQNGTAWAWGWNYSGQLGDGTTTDRSTPVQVAGLVGVTAIAAAAGHTVAVKHDGTAWAWGSNFYGQLGDGTTTDRSTPVQVAGLGGVTAIAAGSWDLGNHTVALKQDGTVWAWGSNDFGQLGDGTYERRLEPVLLVNETFNAPLDLVPETPNNIPPDKIPPFFVTTYRTGNVGATSLSVDVRGITPVASLLAAAGIGAPATGDYNVYVAAAVPSGNEVTYYQLDSNNVWSALTWPMAEFLRGVALGSPDTVVRLNILRNVYALPYIGTSILVGYGASADEMLNAARYRTIFTVLSPW